MWVPPEIKDPILRHAPTRKSVSCFGAVSLETGQFVLMMCPIFNAATFKTFLRRLLRQRTPGRRMIVVLDNARYHHARLLAGFLHRNARQLRLLVWKLARRLSTHNRYFATLAEVLKAVSACFNRWRKPNKVLHRLCCIT
jgi:DDE superfamily endonuclease